MSRNERSCTVYKASSRFGYLHGAVVLQLFEIAMEAVHEFGVLDGMNDESLGQIATREEVGRLYDLIGLRDKELVCL